MTIMMMMTILMTTTMTIISNGSSLAILLPQKKNTKRYHSHFTLLLPPPEKIIFLMSVMIDFFPGNWSGIKATFTFERMASYFFVHVYGPCALIVIISWVSFLLPRSSPPARVTLGVTSVLTVVTILNMLNNSMPKVRQIDILNVIFMY